MGRECPMPKATDLSTTSRTLEVDARPILTEREKFIVTELAGICRRRDG
jgi:hypothetical protein